MSDFIIHSNIPFDLTHYRPPKGGKELYSFEITKLVRCKDCQFRHKIGCPMAFVVSGHILFDLSEDALR